MGCNYANCKTNNKDAITYCKDCLLINFPRLDIEDLYDFYCNIIESIDLLVEVQDLEAFEVHSPEELKEMAFHLYNNLILKKQREYE